MRRTSIPSELLEAAAAFPWRTPAEARCAMVVLLAAHDLRRPHAEFYLSNRRAARLMQVSETTAAAAVSGLVEAHMLERPGTPWLGADSGTRGRSTSVVRLVPWPQWAWPNAQKAAERVAHREPRSAAVHLARLAWSLARAAGVEPLPLVDAADPEFRPWLDTMQDLLDRGYAYPDLRRALVSMGRTADWHATVRILRAPEAMAELIPEHLLRRRTCA